MCLPLRFLKCIVGFTAWVTILTGVASFIVGIIISVKTGGDGSNYYEAIGHVILTSQSISSNLLGSKNRTSCQSLHIWWLARPYWLIWSNRRPQEECMLFDLL